MTKRIGCGAILIGLLAAIGCGSGDDSSGKPGTGGSSATGGKGGIGGTKASGGSGGSTTGGSGGAGAGGTGAAATGGSAGAAGVAGSSGSGGTPAVGNPELFTESVLEMDFSQGTHGRFRANGGTWQDFDSWNTPGNNGSWQNAGVNIQTTNAVRTEIVDNALGAGRVLRTWIEAGDEWKSGASYPRTELTSGTTANVQFKSEWRLEIPFYVTGDVDTSGASIAGFQFHHNGNTGSPPFAFGINNGTLRFSIEEAPSGPNQHTDIFPLQASSLVEIVLELKFGYVADGAYVKLWANGTKYVDITDMNVGYPDLESTAGYWKYCSLYDWANQVKGSRSVHTPTFKLMKKP